jgi:hypothetical protein
MNLPSETGVTYCNHHQHPFCCTLCFSVHGNARLGTLVCNLPSILHQPAVRKQRHVASQPVPAAAHRLAVLLHDAQGICWVFV